MEIKKIEISRLIIHKILGKKERDAELIPSEDLHELDVDTNSTLLVRIFDAVSKSKRFFETALDNVEDGSFWAIAKTLKEASNTDFVDKTIAIAELAVDAHTKKSIPGGILIIIECKIDEFQSIVVIKAELQEALTLKGKAIELIKELFLSPAKEFYKIGILIQNNPKIIGKEAFSTYVYDDNFSPRKGDLATYFYKDFLGFSTSKNDKLTTNNFLTSFLGFVDNNIDEFESRRLIKSKIKADYRESSTGVIDPSSYSEFFQDDEKVNKKFKERILKKFPLSFTKDLALVDSSLQKTSLQITSDLTLSGPFDLVDNIEVYDVKETNSRQKLITKIDSGDIAKVVTLKNEAIRPKF